MAADGREARILMLTAAGTVEDRVVGLELGADDYLPKPFDFAELVARIRALGRRAPQALQTTFARGDLVLDPARRHATRAGRPLALSPKEFAVLECLLAAEGTIVSTRSSSERVWDDTVDPFTTTVKTTIRRLRNKLGDPPVVHTVREGGYRIGDVGWRTTPLAAIRRWLPRRTLQLRLAAFYGGVFLLLGARLLLAIPNVLVRTGTTAVSVGPGGSPFPNGRSVLLQQHGADVHAQLVYSLLALVLLVVTSSASAGWSPAGCCARFGESRPRQGDLRQQPASAARDREALTTSCGSSAPPSTTFSPDWKCPSTRNAGSWPTPRTSSGHH